MKVLYFIPYSPANPTFGGSLRIYHILDHLCSNHDVTVAGFSTPDEERELLKNFPVLEGKTHFVQDPYMNSSRYRILLKSIFSSHSLWYQCTRSAELQQILDRLLENDTYDVIQSEFPVMGMYRFNSTAVKIIDSHNVEYDNFKRMAKVKNPLKKLFYHLESYKFYKEETAACREQSALFVCSERDISILDKSVPGVPKYLIPNGVDEEYFYPTKTTPKPHSLVFVGMMKYVPNYDGINFFLDEIFPKILALFPETTITIVGKNAPSSITRRANKNIIITGFVDDTRPYMHEASVYVVPLRMGGGTRLKIMETLASKIPLVTTSIGCEGIDVEHRKHALIADTPEDFANAVLELFVNNELCKKLTEAGYDLVMEKYRWKSIGKEMDRAYKELTGSKTDGATDDADRMKYEANGIYK
ncbi:MAG: glycosyltransferase [Balneolaceae bacterium]|nr:glycosyltransferase [Balneolaceae bacterium]